MRKIQWQHVLKVFLLLLWAGCIAAIFQYLQANHVSLRHLPRFLHLIVAGAGPFGFLIILTAYLAITVIPFPTAAIAVISGSVYGKFWGTLIVMIGLNMASAVSFYLGRFFGRHWVSEREKGLVKKYDDLMGEEGFYLILVMRLVLVPFDFVSLLSGMTKITFRQYILASILGSLPITVTLVVLGDAFTDPRGWILFGFMFTLSVCLALAAHRSTWAKKHLFKKIEPQNFE